jgi:hypothetical protein
VSVVPVATAAATARPDAIRAIATRAQDALDAAPFTKRFPLRASLAPVPWADVRAQVGQLVGLPRWVNDELCVRRAALLAHGFNQGLGIGSSPVDDASAAAIFMVSNPDNPRVAGAVHHAAVGFWPMGESEPWVVDPLVGPGVGQGVDDARTGAGAMPVSEWARLLGQAPQDVRVRSAFGINTLGASPWGRFTRAGEDLVASFERGEDAAVRGAR